MGMVGCMDLMAKICFLFPMVMDPGKDKGAQFYWKKRLDFGKGQQVRYSQLCGFEVCLMLYFVRGIGRWGRIGMIVGLRGLEKSFWGLGRGVVYRLLV